jgi:serine protease Do
MQHNSKVRILGTIAVSIILLVGAGFSYGAYRWYTSYKSFQQRVLTLIKTQEEKTGAIKVASTKVASTNGIQLSNSHGSGGWIDVQSAVKNTVVKIVADVAAFNWLEPYQSPGVSKASGSGFFINSDGDLVTNYHVINQAQLVQIEIPSLGAERLPVNIVGVSPERDVALLRLTEYSKSRIKKELKKISFLKFGNSDDVRRGQDVLALGYPLGVQALKSTQGIVSGRERIGLIKQSCIQTTAPLNPGNSGGPAINSEGEVIGINFAGVIEAQNVGYIIPINDLKSTIKDLNKVRLLRRPVPGCLLEAVNEDMVSLSSNPAPGGFYIAHIYKNMLLEKAGAEVGDMIYEVNGFKVDRFGYATVPWNEDKVSMLEIFDRLEIGDKVHMVIYRKGVRKEIEFMLEHGFLPPIRIIYPDFEKVDYETLAGLVVMELALNHVPQLAESSHELLAYESSEKQYEPALVVSYVQPTSLVSKLRLIGPGMIISHINGVRVKTLNDFRTAVRRSKKTRYLTVKTVQHWFIALSVDNIVLDEDRLAMKYQFKKSQLINDIA